MPGAVTAGMVHHALAHWVAPSSTRITSAVTIPQVREPYRATPAAPARSNVDTMPSGVRPMIRTLATASNACVPSHTAAWPSRYTDRAKDWSINYCRILWDGAIVPFGQQVVEDDAQILLHLSCGLAARCIMAAHHIYRRSQSGTR